MRESMKSEQINTARNPLLPAAMVAIQRAALRARQIASQTQTTIVVARDGRIEHITPHAVEETADPDFLIDREDVVGDEGRGS